MQKKVFCVYAYGRGLRLHAQWEISWLSHKNSFCFINHVALAKQGGNRFGCPSVCLLTMPSLTRKYTNPARGILDFCKQKLWPLPCSQLTVSPILTTRTRTKTRTRTRPQNVYKFKKAPHYGRGLINDIMWHYGAASWHQLTLLGKNTDKEGTSREGTSAFKHFH